MRANLVCFGFNDDVDGIDIDYCGDVGGKDDGRVDNDNGDGYRP